LTREFDVAERDRSIEQGSTADKRDKSVLTEDIPAGVDEDSCLKLDLRGLEQDVVPGAAAVAVDSARTLADIPEDYLMSASARTVAVDESVAAGTQPVASSPRQDVAEVPAYSHGASIASQSVDVNYSQEFLSAAASDEESARSQRPTETDLSAPSSHVTEETIDTEDDVSEVLSEDGVKVADDASTSDKAASLCKSDAVDVTTSPGAAGK